VLAAQAWAGVSPFRGAGGPVWKSAALSFVSAQPSERLSTAAVLLGAGARPAPSKQAALAP